MRRHFGALLALVLLATLAGPVAAAPPLRSTFSETFLECPEPIVGASGVVILPFAYVATDGTFVDAFADLAFWAALSEPEGDPTLFAVGATGSATATSFSMTVDLADLEDNPAGTAEISATIAPDGEAVSFSERERFSNRWRVSEGTDQPIVVESGTVTIDGGTFDVAGCTGNQRIVHTFETRPNALVIRDTFRDVSCQLAVGERTIVVGGFGGASSIFLFVAVDPDGLGGETDAALTSDGAGGWLAAGTIDVFDSEGEAAGSASIDLHLVPDGDPIPQYLPRRTGWEKSVFQDFTVSGSIAFPDAGVETSDLSGCEARSEELRAVFTSPKGPKAARPSNDTPDGAIALSRGSTVTLRTGGAADGEAPASCLETPFGTVPFSKTVWYTVEGDGSPMTIDTAASDYDTVLAVYIEDDLGDGPVLTEVACVDDIFLDPGRTLQAAISGDTESGLTYWIQVGGFQNEWGRLRLTVQ